LAKSRWLIDEFVKTSKAIYNPEQVMIVDELINPYKGKYCSCRQFMKDKSIRFGIKLWCAACVKSRFVWNIEVYMGLGTGLGEDGQLGLAVCYQLLEGLEKKGHILVCDNFFSSVKLFHNLLCKGIFATGMIIRNRKGLPKALTRQGDMTNPGSLVMKIHDRRHMVGISWQDKELVTLLSTAANPWAPNIIVLRRKRGRASQQVLPSTPVHIQYQENMRGVDVTDILR
jgi:hypothetical protein